MSDSNDWSPDQSLDTETYEGWDEELDAEDEVMPDSVGDPEGERSLDRQLYVDDAEVDELGAALDDPEHMTVLDGDIDDPDGIEPTDGGRPVPADEEGWDLDAEERVTASHLEDDAEP